MDLLIKGEEKKKPTVLKYLILEDKENRSIVRGKLFCRLAPFTHWVNTHATSQHLLVLLLVSICWYAEHILSFTMDLLLREKQVLYFIFQNLILIFGLKCHICGLPLLFLFFYVITGGGGGGW